MTSRLYPFFFCANLVRSVRCRKAAFPFSSNCSMPRRRYRWLSSCSSPANQCRPDHFQNSLDRCQSRKTYYSYTQLPDQVMQEQECFSASPITLTHNATAKGRNLYKYTYICTTPHAEAALLPSS